MASLITITVAPVLSNLPSIYCDLNFWI